jgi:DNA polymerase III gamma/tau subunit
MIFAEDLKIKYPFASKFFEMALTGEESRFAHGFILAGNNVSMQYKMVLDIAKYLNCTKTKNQDCNCINCSWIEDNAHPAVITISPIDYTEKERKKISVDQIRKLRNSLGVTSPYHRVVIITDAKEIECDLPFKAPKLSQNDSERIWKPYPLTQKVFDKSPVNAMLKILEEPPERVTFFFLSNNKDELLPTIVSRCQSISLVSKEEDKTDFSLVSEFLDKIPYKDEAEVFALVQKFLELAKETLPEVLLDTMQKSIKNTLLQNLGDRVFVDKSILLLRKIEEAKNQIKSFVQLQNIIESLFFSLKK